MARKTWQHERSIYDFSAPPVCACLTVLLISFEWGEVFKSLPLFDIKEQKEMLCTGNNSG